MKRFLKDIITDKEHSIKGAFLKPLLWVLSQVFAGLVVLLRTLYGSGILPSYRPQKPVISVGNIMAGGVGKTPLVMYLVRYFQKKGLRPVVLTRGFMPADAPAGVASDEAVMLRESLGVVVMVGADRVAAIKRAQDLSSADLFILDDGFQQWRLKRDLDIAVIDATQPFGNGHVLPRGLLREPVAALARADLFVLTRTDLGQVHVAALRQRLEAIKPGCCVVETVHAPAGIEDAFGGKRFEDFSALKDKVAGVCAIGSPHAFEAMLKAQGADVVKMFVFDDHHHYTDEDVRRVVDFCRTGKISKIVTTQKDVVKLRHLKQAFQGVSLLVLKIEIKVVHGETELFSGLDRLRHS